MDRRAKFSALWAFVLFNYIYADIVRMIVTPETYQTAAARMPSWVMLAATALMEILIAMVIIPHFLAYRANRAANMVAGIFGTIFVFISLGGNPPAAYVLLSMIEIAGTLFIIWYAWTWREIKGHNT